MGKKNGRKRSENTREMRRKSEGSREEAWEGRESELRREWKRRR